MDEKLIAILLLAALLLALRAWQQRRKRQRQYQRRAQDQGLRPAQRRLLWQVARKQQRNPVLLLRSATTFELCVGECARTGAKGPILAELARIRLQLGFDPLPAGQPLRSTHQLAQGQTLSLWPVGEEKRRAQTCLVVSAGEAALILAPLSGTTPAWSPGLELRACLQREPEVEYHFVTQVLARTRYSLSLQHGSQVERLQAREFLRWDTAFPLTLLTPARQGRKQPVEGTVTNISGGGLRLQVQQGVPLGARVVVDPQYRGPFPLAGVKGKVVATSPRPSGRALHLQFVDLPRPLEAQIIRRIYQHQLGHLSRVHAHHLRRGAPDDRQ